jgi:serine/threonine protein kinase
MLELDPNKRITAFEALNHSYFKQEPIPCDPKDLPKIDKDSHEFQSRQNKKQQFQNQKGEMIVAKHGYNVQNNANYYHKNNLGEPKIKIEENKIFSIQENSQSSETSNTRLRALLVSNVSSNVAGNSGNNFNNQNEQIFLSNKRSIETTNLETENYPHKKQRTNFSPHK